MIFPKPLKRGDKILILSPASTINPSVVDAGAETLRKWGFIPVISEHCKEQVRHYSQTVETRAEDIINGYKDPSIKAIICSRGGYGLVHLLDLIPDELIRDNPKWVIGFSDISVWHAKSITAGVASLHAPMCKHLASWGGEDQSSQFLKSIITGTMPTYTLSTHKYNNAGVATGEIVGGNLAVLMGLVSTPNDIMHAGKILFIEDVGENIYRIERMLYTLKHSGVLANLAGLIVGKFTEYPNDNDFGTMYTMIHNLVKDYDYPIAFNFPVGHVDHNLPIIEGAKAKLIVTDDIVTLKF